MEKLKNADVSFLSLFKLFTVQSITLSTRKASCCSQYRNKKKKKSSLHKKSQVSNKKERKETEN